MNKLLLIALIFGCIYGCKPKPEPPPEIPIYPEKVITNFPKNIVLLIGNGMGLAHITAGIYRHTEPLNIQKFPSTGVHKPNIGNYLVADSLAVAGAISTGLNLLNFTDSTIAKSILSIAKEKGKKVGIITDNQILGAIPSTFIDYKNAGKQQAIVADFFDQSFDLFIGKNHDSFKKYSDRNDYEIIEIEEKDINFNTDKKLVGLLNSSEEFSHKNILKSLGFLKTQNLKGFFLLVENSKIKDAAYQNNGEKIAQEIINFDKTVGEILKFAETDKETLVILTSNQEAGGFTLNSGTSRDTIFAGFTTKENTGILLPVFAYGPGAELFEGMYENTAIFTKIKKAMQLN